MSNKVEKEYKELKHLVYVRKTKFGYQASFLEDDKFIEVKSKLVPTPRSEGWYRVFAEEGFNVWISKVSGKKYVYANGQVIWLKASPEAEEYARDQK